MGTSSQTGTPARRYLPALLALFALSGGAALIYEVVWLQLLQLVIGSSAASLAVLLGTFMGGMCLGSLALGRVVPAGWHPLRVYAGLELGTGAFGLAVLFGLPLVERIYTVSVAHGGPGLLLRSVASAVCLLAPTMMMGATLPAMSRWIGGQREKAEVAAWWGYFYGGNIAGGVVGCLAAGFWLLRVYDMAVASYVAVGVNLCAAAGSWAIARSVPFGRAAVGGAEEGGVAEGGVAEGGAAHERVARAGGGAKRAWAVYGAVGISGLCALGAEVAWTRTLSLMLGPTVYTFSIILGVFLGGLGMGSSAGAGLARRLGARSRAGFGVCQVLLVFAIAWAANLLADFLPYWHGNVDGNYGLLRGFANDLARAALPVLPAAILWGASFPLALAAAAEEAGEEERGDPARLVGEIYGANTVGAIAGSLVFGLLVIPRAGSQRAEQMLVVLAAAGALLLLAREMSRAKLAGAVVAAGLMAWSLPGAPWKLIAFGRRLATTTGQWTLLQVSEGMNSSIAYSKAEGKTTYFHVSGKTEASAEPQDMRLQRLLGHLPALLHPGAKSVLIVGCGAGVTAGTFVVHPEIGQITICEIEPLIPPSSAKYFGKENHDVVRDRRTRIVYDDARHFVLTTQEKFDIITSDPIHPWVKGIAPLYSTEYFELVKKHLNPGGFVTQWVPLYESSVETVQSELATFFEAFPDGTVWGNLNTDGAGYDVVLVGQMGPLKIDVDGMERRLARPENARVVESLKEVGYNSATDLLATYAVSAGDLRGWLRDAQINRDRNLRLQYLAGLGLNKYLAPDIYNDMLKWARFPDEMFGGTAEKVQAVKAAILNPKNAVE